VNYWFKTTSKNSAAERFIYKKDNQEIKFGFLFESYEFEIWGSKKFLKNYDQENGISFNEIGYYGDCKRINPKKIIFFSETISENDKKNIQMLFDKDLTSDLSKFEKSLNKNKWSLTDHNCFVWGVLSSEILCANEEDEILLKKYLI
jgi:hypothetical protein